MLKDYVIYVVKNLGSRKMRSWLTMIGIFIGIAAVVSLISLGDGMKNAITSQFASLGTDKLTVQASSTGFGPPGSTAVTKLSEHNADAIRKIRGVELAVERLIRVAKFEFNDEQSFSYITSLPEDAEERRLVLDVVNLDIIAGRPLNKDEKTEVVLGNDFYTRDTYGKKLKLGDLVKVRDKEFEIVGFLERGGNPIFNGLIFMNEEPLRDLMEIGDEVDIIAVKVTDQNEIDKVAKDIEKVMRKERDVEEGKEDFIIQTPAQIIESLNAILNVVQAVLVGIAAISLLVGGIGIMNTMYTAVLERKREIGIMKSIGARNSDILKIFLIESGMLGLVGGLIGIAIGVGLSKLVEVGASVAFGPNFIQAKFSLFLIIGSLVFSFLVGTASGVFPARQAAYLQPVEALRK